MADFERDTERSKHNSELKAAQRKYEDDMREISLG